MASKLDKEKLIKHRFWICLGVMSPLVLISLIVLMAGASSDIEAKKAEFDTSVSGLKKINSPKNSSWVQILEKRGKQAEAKRTEIWEKAWSSQVEDFTSWPIPGPAKGYETEPRNFYFGDELSQNDRALFIDDDMYPTQFKPIIDTVQPVDDRGVGVVQFKNDPMTMIRHVDVWNRRPPSSEDVWLAQEDLWVQKALLKIIREANDGVANLREVKKLEPDKAKNELQRSLFLNTAWQMDLAVANGPTGKPVLRFSLRNLTIHRQFLGLDLHVFVRAPDAADAKPGQKKDDLLGDELIKIDGEPLNPNQSTSVLEKPLSAAYVPGAKLEVQQVLDWKSGAVRRIDMIALGQHSDRTKHDGLRAAKVFTKDQPAPAEAKPAAGGGAGAGGMGAALANPGGGGGGRGGGSKTANGLERNRYNDDTPQVRRMPVGLLLVVDQAYIQEVLTAVANSNMRVQVTQVQWQHYRGPDIKPKITITRPARSGDKKPAGGGVPKAGEGQGNIGGGPPKPGAGKPAGDAAATNEEPSDLVELAVYGIASLYERYPPKEEKGGRAAPPKQGK